MPPSNTIKQRLLPAAGFGRTWLLVGSLRTTAMSRRNRGAFAFAASAFAAHFTLSTIDFLAPCNVWLETWTP